MKVFLAVLLAAFAFTSTFAIPLVKEVFPTEVFDTLEYSFDNSRGNATNEAVLRKLECIQNVVNETVSNSTNQDVINLWEPINIDVTNSLERLRGCRDLDTDEDITDCTRAEVLIARRNLVRFFRQLIDADQQPIVQVVYRQVHNQCRRQQGTTQSP